MNKLEKYWTDMQIDNPEKFEKLKQHESQIFLGYRISQEEITELCRKVNDQEDFIEELKARIIILGMWLDEKTDYIQKLSEANERLMIEYSRLNGICHE